MASFFAEDDDSDIERSEKQRRSLMSIQRASAVVETDEFKDHQDAEARQDQFSEEAELRMLRENARYRKYLGGRKRDISPKSTSSPKRPRPENCVDDDESGGNAPFLGATVTDEKQQSEDTFAIKRVPALLHYEGRQSKPQAEQKGKKFADTRSKLDPKILDDSSEDESESDDENSDSPIGPVLPKESLTVSPANSELQSLPILEEATLGAGHDASVSSISIERAGNRMATASLDSTVKLWDFSTMTRSLQAFKTIKPCGDIPLRSVQFSTTGSQLLCSGGANTATVLDRDGNVLSRTTAGDMYIVDMARTKGHTGDILATKWKPSGGAPSKIFATSSADGTARLWDITRTRKMPMTDTPAISQMRVAKLRDVKGTRFVATAMDWISDGTGYILGCSDGKLRVLDPSSYSLRPVDESQKVFPDGAEITALACASDTSSAPYVISRSMDDCLRVFDRRKLANPLRVFENLPNAVSETNTCFGGDTSEFFVTGTSANRKDTRSQGRLVLFSARRMQEVWRSEVQEGAGSVISTIWHSTLNQIAYGCADGKIRVLYHPEISRKGILGCIPRTDKRKRHGVASVGVGEVILPTVARHNVPSAAMSARQATVGSGGVQERQTSEMTSAHLQPQVSSEKSRSAATKQAASEEVNKEWFGDPRKAILRYAEVAAKNPMFTNAYQTTQPEIILAEKTAEQEEEETRRAIYERDRIRRAIQQQKKGSN